MILRIDYDDHLEDVVDKVNKVLEAVNLKFVIDDEEHDGFCLFELKNTD